MTRSLPARPDIAQYRKRAKELVRACQAGDESALARIRAHHPRLRHAAPDTIRQSDFALADAQLVLARELGLPSWPRLKAHIERLLASEIRGADQGFYWYADKAGRIVKQLGAGGPLAFEAARRWHPDLANATDLELSARSWTIEDGRTIVSREHGFETWPDFVVHLEAAGGGPHELTAADPAAASAAEKRFADAVRAIQRGRPDELGQLLEADPALLLAHGAEGQGLLLLAAAERSADLVAMLLAAGADPNEADRNGWTPLHQAAYGEPPEPETTGQRRSLEVMEALLAAGARLDSESRGSGGTPLLQALFWGLRPLAERLAEEGVVPENLRTAAGLGRLDLLEEFFDAEGALQPEAGRSRGYAAPHSGFPDPTPDDSPEQIRTDALVYAAGNGRLAAVDALLDHGADPNLAPYQETPLMAAVRGGHAEVARRLLARGADVNSRGSWAAMSGVTALHHAVSVARLDMVQLLVEAGADLAARDDTASGSPAGWAAHFENADIEAYLKEAAGTG